MSLKEIKIFLILILFFSCKNKQEHIQTPEIKTQEYHIYCDESELKQMFENYRDNNYIPITIKKENIQRNAGMRIRGDSSRDYDKKSLKIKILDSLSIDAKMIFNFNAEYSDLSFLRSFISSKIFKKMNYPCFSTSFSKIYINDNYHGFFLEVENMDKNFLKKNGLNPNGDLFKATKDGACLYSLSELTTKWEKKTNKKSSYISLEKLIYDLSNIKDEDFYDYIIENFDYPMLIDFLAINAFIANGSTYYHNYYLYRDLENNGKWILLPWDLDKTISYYDWKPYKYNETSSDWESDNILIEKCFLNEQIFSDFKKRIEFIGTIINGKFYNPIFDSAIQNLKHEIINDSTNKIKSEKEWIKTINKEKSFLNERSEKIIKFISNAPSSFKVNQIHNEISIPFKISWEKPISNLDVNYELWISNDFLFPEESTYKFKTDSLFYWIKQDIPNGEYYWKVIATNKFDSSEGFNTKNIFLLKDGTVLPKIINEDIILKKENSPYRVNSDLKIEESVTINIEPGTTILMEENTEITCHGVFNAIGTQNNPINIAPLEANSYFNSLYFLNSKSSLKHVNIKDGLVNSKYSDLKIENTTIEIDHRPMQIGDKRPSIIWGWHGNIELNNICLKGNNEGEGINISYSNARIENSDFYNTPDAIELINVDRGFIINNIVMNSPDDAIDLNDCSNIEIKSNYLINNYDKGISIGTDWANEFISKNPQFNGKSINIKVSNNYILGNNIGIAVKDSSIVNSKNNIISFNKTGFKLYKKHEDYKLGGTLYSELDQINDNSNNIYKDEFSKIKIKNKADSIQLIPTKNSFVIPNLIKYSISQENLSLNPIYRITIQNESNIHFDLDGMFLLNDEDIIFIFNKNHIIEANQSIIIGNDEVNEKRNYFYNSDINYQDLNQLYLKNLNSNKIPLLK
tara:strand:- start:844 stop:3591 length:2748 start_codon:yes stop_codon:yes gene_type:complete